MEGFVSLNTQVSAYNISLRSKRFQSSNCAKVRAGAKKGAFLFFCSRPNFSRRTRAETIAKQAITILIISILISHLSKRALNDRY